MAMELVSVIVRHHVEADIETEVIFHAIEPSPGARGEDRKLGRQRGRTEREFK